MLRRINDLLQFTIRASDGPIGHVHDLYFDDHAWTIRYVVADTSRWLPGRRVLVSPISVRDIDGRRRTLNVNLTEDQIRNSPDIDTDKSVSRQHEIDFHDYFVLSYYWVGGEPWGMASAPVGLNIPEQKRRDPYDEQSPHHAAAGDPHLRSARFVVGHTIQAVDTEIGHVEDFLFDDSSWAIRYMVVDTRNWWPGKRVLVAPAWIAWVSWLELKVRVKLASETIRRAPPYAPSRLFTPEDEVRLLSYYGQSEHRATGGRASPAR